MTGCEDLKAVSLEERLGSAVIGFKDMKDLDSSMAIGNVSSFVLAQILSKNLVQGNNPK